MNNVETLKHRITMAMKMLTHVRLRQSIIFISVALQEEHM